MSQHEVDDLGLQIAKQVRRLRLARQWSREELAERANINVYTLKHFERFGQISLERFLRICQILGILEDTLRAFKPRQRVDVNEWSSLSMVSVRQRGRKRKTLLTKETVE
ncbi:MAG: hypothetical protein A3F41_02725 [Coxiella sp. RIFCSPHIGHO2_12_FULL_44_14]|nr:MAG: hypothetical protein A3F41_02725 [Coxiella sp. RIFCSPHIGHO2_12_FULL_44_14]